MNCSIFEAGHIKVLARVITTFAKIGDDIYFHARKDGLKLITFNLSKTVYAECCFTRSFFTKYEVDEEEMREKNKDSITCKIFVKYLLSFFKGHIDKKLKNLKISYNSDSDFIIIDMNYSAHVRMLNTVRLMEFENLQMAVQPNCGKNNIYGNSRSMTQILSVFCPSDKELTMEILHSKLIVRNYRVGTPRAKGSMRSQITLNTHEFSLYDIREETMITFIFKPFKILTHFAEIFGLPFRLNYMAEGRPMTVSATDPTFEVNFILATLNPDESTPPMTLDIPAANTSRITAPLRSYAAKVIRPLGEDVVSSIFPSGTPPSAPSPLDVIELDEQQDTEERLLKRPKTSFNLWLDRLIEDQNNDANEKSQAGNPQEPMDLSGEINFGSKSQSRLDKKGNQPPSLQSEKFAVETSGIGATAGKASRSLVPGTLRTQLDKNTNQTAFLQSEKFPVKTCENGATAGKASSSSVLGILKTQFDKRENQPPFVQSEKFAAKTHEFATPKGKTISSFVPGKLKSQPNAFASLPLFPQQAISPLLFPTQPNFLRTRTFGRDLSIGSQSNKDGSKKIKFLKTDTKSTSTAESQSDGRFNSSEFPSSLFNGTLSESNFNLYSN